jgi:hypothetical protein
MAASLLIVKTTPLPDSISFGLYDGDRALITLCVTRKLAATATAYANGVAPMLAMLGQGGLISHVQAAIEAVNEVLGGAAEARRTFPALPAEML